ncbi:DUF2652 domain-containing protein [Aquimarina sp. 2201CG5-10]|uniref:DUF2652 domain-containing protein n=1 Tax=Aquimarina callyspongiae TaxID=3098150 RepID=UPI002AB4A466|nr:DUF2652 domain-containing protein [Aquimarina sp. 2201CG5-10]MDY8135757.1 DUF2652 domain-containing protein [Aquimarina sp. 2201CG5-10]
MKNYALYFMPDISGFTNFVTNTEVEHSKHIISELLEILIDSNIIDLKLVEIEGDALFMYTTEIPQFDHLIEQSKKMLSAFSTYLNLYNTNRICECGACTTAHNLQVKFIIHYGEIAYIRVKDIVKPYGGDVIKIHRFLKNSIPSNQYLLISKETIDYYEQTLDNSEFEEKADHYDFGISHYYFKELESEKAIKRPALKKPAYEPQIDMQITIPGNVNQVYQFISDFKVRTSWYKLIDRLDYDEFRINRIGTTHNCISGSDIFKVETLGDRSKTNNSLVYGERTADIKNLDLYSYYLTVQQKEQNYSVLKAEVYLDFKPIEEVQKKEIIKNLEEAWKLSLSCLEVEMIKENF